jgi:type IV secretory pathway protease TraF
MLSKNNIEVIFKSKLFYLLIGLVFSIPFVYEKSPIRIDITQQESLPQKVWITYSDLSINSNYILFNPPKNKYMNNSDIKYLKKIVCKEGDFLKVKNRDYFCNEDYIGTASYFDGKLKPIENFTFNGVVPKDKYFVAGEHILSYDSKYFGFIDKSQILRKAKPFF